MTSLSWIPPDFDAEAHELDRYIGDSTVQEVRVTPNFFSSREEARTCFDTGRLESHLDPNLPLRNFDAALVEFYRNGRVTLDQLVTYYTRRQRRCAMIVDAYRHGGQLTAILVLRVGDDYYELVSGNTRLVMGRVLEKAPMFWVVRIDSNLSLQRQRPNCFK